MLNVLEGHAREGGLGAWWDARPEASPFASRVSERARDTFAVLERAAAGSGTIQERTVLEAARGVMGLGPGGTPAGDDALVGFLAAWMRSEDGGAGGIAHALALALAESARMRTTRLAAEFYHHLARDRVSRDVDTVLDAVWSGDDRRTASAVRALAGYGATSGRDTIAGIFRFLSAKG